MQLSKETLGRIKSSGNLFLPRADAFSLPEKVLQFGTGVLLRGLPDLLINNANNAGVFNGRIVIVKSTAGGGDAATYNKQDGLYTVCVRGIEKEKTIDEIHISAAVSRVLTAADEWDAVLACAENSQMQLVISNTTEIGITFAKDDVHASPPASFPGKLLSFLYHRFRHFEGDATKGMVIVPTELIPSNGEKLLSVLLEMAHENELEPLFIDWLESANKFCNSLVDRIVPGKLPATEEQRVSTQLGYSDGLMIMAEPYALWAIECADEGLKDLLSFSRAGRSTVVATNITKFRELKLRLLNGSHTFTCGLAFLAGFSTVKEAMQSEDFSNFIRRLMLEEIIPAFTGAGISESEAREFAEEVLDRYRNNFIDHKWLTITAQYSSKMYLRNVSLIENYYARTGRVPSLMSLGMAAHILFLRSTENEDGKFYGDNNGEKYLITDENAALYSAGWKKYRTEFIAEKLLSNTDLWQTDLNGLPGFAAEVTQWLHLLKENGAMKTMKFALSGKTSAVYEK